MGDRAIPSLSRLISGLESSDLGSSEVSIYLLLRRYVYFVVCLSSHCMISYVMALSDCLLLLTRLSNVLKFMLKFTPPTPIH